jgi:hypothetical protein
MISESKMRLILVLTLAALSAGCGPSFTGKDREFESRLAQALEDESNGPLATGREAALLAQLFGEEVEQVCFLGGGDWVPGVSHQWESGQALPIPPSQLRDLGSDDLSFDGMVAIVGVTPSGAGLVRRGWFGDPGCSDYADGPVCWPVNVVALEVVRGSTPDAGQRAGQAGVAVEFVNRDTGARTCRYEPGRR